MFITPFDMSTIRILPDQVANRIAAGEVVERPVAVVKELVDNGIDAGADRISIQFKQGGKSYILVEDNGKGMSSDDALLCIERHATSKIKNSDDLFNIQTLGFRGEAIPSIASVSRFQLRTRQKDDLEGTEILINGGKLIHKKEIGMAPGTRIEVTHLFSSMPARRKFLKTDNTEASHIIQWIRLIAIAHPQIGFRLQSNQRTLLSLPVHKKFLERIKALWGKELETQLMPIQFETDGIKGYGYIGKAGVSRPSRQDIITIVNGRPVESRTLGFAFTEAYHTHIPKGRYPVVFLHLNVDPTMIDVNIHPSKKEIKFKSESKIRTLIIQTVWAALRSKEQKTEQESTRSSPKLPNPQTIEQTSERTSPSTTAVPKSSSLEPPVKSQSIPIASDPNKHQRQHPHTASQAIPIATSFSHTSPTKTAPIEEATPNKPPQISIENEWRFIGDYKRSYSIFERSSGLTLLHNTRALRRIDFEKILHSLNHSSVTTQQEMVPVSFELDVHLSIKIKKLIPLLNDCYIRVEEFGRNFYRIEEAPSFLEAESAKEFVLDWLRDEGHLPADLSKMRNQLALICCRKNSHLASLPLKSTTAMDVLKRLLNCDQPMVDPDGKPIIHHLAHRMFDNLKGLEKLQ